MWRGARLGDYACGRVARYVFETRVGLTRTHRTCGDDDCVRSLTQGYPVFAWRDLP